MKRMTGISMCSVVMVAVVASAAQAGGLGDAFKSFGGNVSKATKSAGGRLSNATKAAGGRVSSSAKAVGGRVSNGAKATGGQISRGSKSIGGYVSSKSKSIGGGISNAWKTTGRDMSGGFKHVTRTPVKWGKPNWGYMRDTLNHRPFANDRGEFGKRLGGWTTQDFGVEAATVISGTNSAKAMNKIYWHGRNRW